MKRFPKFCAAACLTLVLAISALGDGQIGCPYIPPPPPPTDQPVAQPADSGLDDAITQTVLDILQNVLSLV